MNKPKSYFALVVFLFMAGFAQAQTVPEYFQGKWNVLVKDTPNGDVTMPLRFEHQDGKLNGFFTNLESGEEQKMTSVEVKGEELVVAYSMAGYDLSLVLKKQDSDHASGRLMDMLDAVGTRVKE
jgi:hypothetical protein